MPAAVPFTVRQTETFIAWLGAIRDRKTQTRIRARIDRLEFGNLGDTKSLGDGLYELRLDFGPGYRIYFIRTGATIVVLLSGGDKSTQRADILRAKELAADFED